MSRNIAKILLFSIFMVIVVGSIPSEDTSYNTASFLKSAKTIKVTIRYKGDGIDMSPVFQDFIRLCFNSVGVQVVSEAASSHDASIVADINAKAISADYGPRRGIVYTGASMVVTLHIEMKGYPPIERKIQDQISPPDSIIVADLPSYGAPNPLTAPFDQLFGCIMEEILVFFGEIYGPESLISFYKKISTNQLSVDKNLYDNFDKKWKAVGNTMPFTYGSFFIRTRIFRALEKMGDISSECLIRVLKSEKDSWIRSQAAKSLGKIKDYRGIEPLIGVLNEDFFYRQEIFTALEEITGQKFGEDKIKWQKWWEENKIKYRSK